MGKKNARIQGPHRDGAIRFTGGKFRTEDTEGPKGFFSVISLVLRANLQSRGPPKCRSLLRNSLLSLIPNDQASLISMPIDSHLEKNRFPTNLFRFGSTLLREIILDSEGSG